MRNRMAVVGVIVLPFAACGCGKAEGEVAVAAPGGAVNLKPGLDGGVTTERVFGVRGKWGAIDWNPKSGEFGFSPLWVPLMLTVNEAGEAKLEFTVGVGSRGPVGAKVKWELGRTEGYGAKPSQLDPRVEQLIRPGFVKPKPAPFQPNPAFRLGQPKATENLFTPGK